MNNKYATQKDLDFWREQQEYAKLQENIVILKMILNCINSRTTVDGVLQELRELILPFIPNPWHKNYLRFSIGNLSLHMSRIVRTDQVQGEYLRIDVTGEYYSVFSLKPDVFAIKVSEDEAMNDKITMTHIRSWQKNTEDFLTSFEENNPFEESLKRLRDNNFGDELMRYIEKKLPLSISRDVLYKIKRYSLKKIKS